VNLLHIAYLTTIFHSLGLYSVEWKNKVRGRGIILWYYLRICLEGLRRTTRNLSQDNRSPDWDLNRGPPIHKAGVLTTRPRRSVVAGWATVTVAMLWDHFCLESGRLMHPLSVPDHIWSNMQQQWNYDGRGNQSSERKLSQCHFYPSQIPRGVTRTRTQALAVRSLQATNHLSYDTDQNRLDRWGRW
jgi:hypothetical protein